MFSHGADSAHDAGGVGVSSGGATVPTRFVWPYGGKRVFLSGSFTRWSEHLPMSPVEGCPTVFQAICSLSPGVYQYKFFVDGEWRHDERQPTITGDYGVVNTLYLTRDINQINTVLSPSTPGSRMNMDVDNENFQRTVSLSDGALQDGHQRVSEASIQISRCQVSEYLSLHTGYDLLPDSGKVIALDINLPVKQSFHILHEQGIPVAPLWDSYRGQFVGLLSPLDFILILRELETHGSNLTEEQLETHTISAWKEAKRQTYGRNEGQWRPQQHLVHATPYDSLRDIALKILQNGISTVPVIYSPSSDGSFPQLLHLASLSGILKCICRYFKNSTGNLPILNQPVCTIPLGSWLPKIGDPNGRPLVMLRPNASLSSALNLLVQAGVSSIPIVDENDSLLDTYSRSDITALAKDKVYTRVRLDEMTINQALQLGQDANTPFGFFNGQRCQMCLRSDPLLKVMERLANPGVRRVFIVEAGSKRVEGIISLSDIFKFLLSL
ncbi:sucrose nonfermenting 4-like protein [Phragmites australis]|uniref:sucrose nonfermenting 4-like protein n=1 Tax=Phragmites australis TaxID=29695 RepID=UPI002D764B58|nr:sucrose nonfermenting 4-like protein [Phragmites australis]